MIKIAVFVEGQSELIMLREFLLRQFEWDVDIKCYRLYQKGQFSDTPYPNERPDSKLHYSIYNVGNDVAVLDEILRYEGYLWKQGFDRIIGLRDMYSEAYKSFSNKIDPDINERFLSGHSTTISKNAVKPEKINFHFSIMEVEAWMIAMYSCFELVNAKLTAEAIFSALNIDLKTIDPETSIFHPAKLLHDILQIAGIAYDKKVGDIEKICKHYTKEEYDKLYQNPYCQSFNGFYDSLLEN